MEKALNYTVYNSLGQQVLKGKVEKNERIDIQNLSSDLYLFKLEDGNTLKFIKK